MVVKDAQGNAYSLITEEDRPFIRFSDGYPYKVLIKNDYEEFEENFKTSNEARTFIRKKVGVKSKSIKKTQIYNRLVKAPTSKRPYVHFNGQKININHLHVVNKIMDSGKLYSIYFEHEIIPGVRTE